MEGKGTYNFLKWMVLVSKTLLQDWSPQLYFMIYKWENIHECGVQSIYYIHLELNTTQPDPSEKFSIWTHPHFIFFFFPLLKLKFDGSFTAHNGLGGIQGIIRNHKGKATFSYAENLLQTIRLQLKLEHFTRGFTFICIPGPILNSEGRFSPNLTVTRQE